MEVSNFLILTLPYFSKIFFLIQTTFLIQFTLTTFFSGSHAGTFLIRICSASVVGVRVFHLGRFQTIDIHNKVQTRFQIPVVLSLPSYPFIHVLVFLLSGDLLRTQWLTNRRWSWNWIRGNELVYINLLTRFVTLRYSKIAMDLFQVTRSVTTSSPARYDQLLSDLDVNLGNRIDRRKNTWLSKFSFHQHY